MLTRNGYNFVHQRIHNTVIKKKSVTVHYPHHPFYKKTLSVIEIRKRENPWSFLCQITETTTLVIPHWMTLPEADVFCSIHESPKVSFESLLELADYLYLKRNSREEYEQ